MELEPPEAPTHAAHPPPSLTGFHAVGRVPPPSLSPPPPSLPHPSLSPPLPSPRPPPFAVGLGGFLLVFKLNAKPHLLNGKRDEREDLKILLPGAGMVTVDNNIVTILVT